MRPEKISRRVEPVLTCVFKKNLRELLLDLEKDEWYIAPKKMNGDPSLRNRKFYCKFHRDHGHITDNCRHLKWRLEDWTKKGYLDKYIDKEKTAELRGQTAAEVHAAGNLKRIMGIHACQPSFGLCERIEQKKQSHIKHLGKEISAVNPEGEGSGSEKRICVGADSLLISYSDEDFKGVKFPHNDAINISAEVVDFEVERILVDQGSACDIMYGHMF